MSNGQNSFYRTLNSLKLKIYQKLIYDLFIGMHKETYRTFNEYKQLLLSDASTVRCDSIGLMSKYDSAK